MDHFLQVMIAGAVAVAERAVAAVVYMRCQRAAVQPASSCQRFASLSMHLHAKMVNVNVVNKM